MAEWGKDWATDHNERVFGYKAAEDLLHNPGVAIGILLTLVAALAGATLALGLPRD